MPALNASPVAQSDLIEQLISIWSHTLQTSEIFPESDFFEMGGDSLLAVNLFLEVERVTGRHLSITAIYDAPTVAELAALLEQEGAAPFNPLVLLKEGGSGSPLFIVHGVGGTVIDLAAVGRMIESDGPVYAIQARGIDGQDAPLQTIEEMADFYVDAVRKLAPVGPYRLAGYSFGGMVAIEMARRLSPDNVSEIILLDAFAHPQSWPRISRLQVRLTKLTRQIVEKTKLQPRELASFILGLARKATARQPQSATTDSGLIALRDWLGTVRSDLPVPLRETRIAGSKALLSYRMSYYPGKIIFLRAGTTGDVFPRNARTVWRTLVSAMELQTIEGSHLSIVDEHAATTAAAISACLGSAVERNRRAALGAPHTRRTLQLVRRS